MDLADAIEIVLELVRQIIADAADMPHEHAGQVHAICVVEGFRRQPAWRRLKIPSPSSTPRGRDRRGPPETKDWNP